MLDLITSAEILLSFKVTFTGRDEELPRYFGGDSIQPITGIHIQILFIEVYWRVEDRI